MFGELGKDDKGWGITTLGECCELNPKRPRDIDDELLVSFVPMPAVSEDGKIDCSDIKPYKEVRKGFTYFAENDVLFAKITPCMENGKGAVAKGLEGGIGFGSTEFHVLRPIAGKSNPYWLYILTMFESFRVGARKVMTGTGGQLRVPIGYLNDYSITLPPIDLQDRFEEFVHQSDKSKFVRFKSQFIEMFYDKGYPVKSIGDVVDRKIARVAKVFSKTDEIQYLDISSIDNASKTVTGLTPYTLMDAPSRAQYVLAKDDIVYSTVRPNLQNIAINPYEEENVVGSTGFCVLRCTGVSTGYMWGVVNSTLFTDTMINKASGANYPAVTDKVVLAYEIPIPPEDQQLAYEHLVRQSDKSK